MADKSQDNNRRRENRLEYVTECKIVTSTPGWAMLPEPLKGTTLNVTQNGVKVKVLNFPRDRFQRWNTHIERGESIGVTVSLPRTREPLELPGQVVWMNYEPATDGHEAFCSLGILLSLMTPPQSEALQRLVDGLSTSDIS